MRAKCTTALAVALEFAFLGEAIFRFLGVTADDFPIAGGVLLLVFAVQDLMIGGKIASLFLAAIGVMMVRVGVIGIVAKHALVR